MKLGIMQPYFFPYIGYWQLINYVDKYVVYDDVNFIKGGWVNRNRILLNNEAKYFNLPMIGSSSFKKINDINVNINYNLINKNLRTIESAYKRAPYYNNVYPILTDILSYNNANLAQNLFYSIKRICEYLTIKTELVLSSKVEKNVELKGEEKVINICKVLKATEYINTIGGMDLYSFKRFKESGIKLSFFKAGIVKYNQFNNEFIPNLSIIDVMMFNSKDEIKDMLKQYELISEA